MSPYGYTRYGNPINFRTMRDVRKYDIFIFTSILGVSHIGFIQSYDADAGILKIIGGNQAGTVKVTDMPFSVTDPLFRVLHVKRNWGIPFNFDSSIYPSGGGAAANDVFPIAPLSPITTQTINNAGFVDRIETALNSPAPTRPRIGPR
jgi:hypothetical protein